MQREFRNWCTMHNTAHCSSATIFYSTAAQHSTLQLYNNFSLNNCTTQHTAVVQQFFSQQLHNTAHCNSATIFHWTTAQHSTLQLYNNFTLNSCTTEHTAVVQQFFTQQLHNAAHCSSATIFLSTTEISRILGNFLTSPACPPSLWFLLQDQI